MKIIAIIKTVKLKNLSLQKIFRYKNFFKPLLILAIVLCIGLSFFFQFQSKVNAKEEDKVNTKVEELTKKEYDYELTKLLVKRKGKSELETVILDSDLENETVISSLEVGKQKVDLEENNQRKKILKKKLKELLQDKDIEYAQPSYLYTSEAWTREGDKDTPDDYDASIHWYYEKANLREMWKVQDCVNDGEKCGGSSDVTVAVVDTGLAFENHTSVWADVGSNPFVFSPATDLFVNGSVNLYTNSGEVENDGVDNDGNGFVDDYHGVNTENYVYCKRNGCNSAQKAETGHPNDDVGHGTYVTGLITSLVGNGTGSVSPAHNITIMPIKANYPKLPLFGTAELVTAIDYAVANGANIINLSLAGSGMDPLLKEAVDRAYSSGVLVVAASGNSGGSVQYPAKHDSVVAVGAVNALGNRANYSSYGPELDLVAYVGNGGGIGDATYQISYKCFGRSGDLGCVDSTKEGEHYNLDPNRYTEFEAKYGIGTSYAAPQVSALAAIIWGNNPDANVEDIKLGILASTSSPSGDTFNNATGYGVIDWLKANSFDCSDLQILNLPVYRYINGDKAWLWVSNSSVSERIFVGLNIAGTYKGIYAISPQTNLPLSFPDTFAGPVIFRSYSPQIQVSLKARTPNGKLSETKAVGNSNFSKKYYYPVYRYIDEDRAWIWITNPSKVDDSEFEIILNDEYKGTYTISPGELKSFSFPGEFNGPLILSATEKISSTLKMRTGGGLSEVTGISEDDFSNIIYYPVYRYVNGDGAWIWIGNPSINTNVNVKVTIAGTDMGDYSILPNSNIGLGFPEVFDGPVVLQSDNLIYSTMKARTGGMINEFSGIIPSEFSKEYNYPIYRYIDEDGAWIWIGNPNEEVANIQVFIKNNLMGNYQVNGKSKIALSYPGIFEGPVKIKSDRVVYSTLKSRSNGSLNEFKGFYE